MIDQEELDIKTGSRSVTGSKSYRSVRLKMTEEDYGEELQEDPEELPFGSYAEST